MFELYRVGGLYLANLYKTQRAHEGSGYCGIDTEIFTIVKQNKDGHYIDIFSKQCYDIEPKAENLNDVYVFRTTPLGIFTAKKYLTYRGLIDILYKANSLGTKEGQNNEFT